MAKGTSRPMRVAEDVAIAAAHVASAEHRSETEQMNYWARLGMQLDRATSASGRRTLAVVRGEAQFSTLEPDERTAAHATIDARMADRVAQQSFGPAARRAGQVTVSVDDEGCLVEISPDGSRRPL